jgi:glycosyltransferase involved in cell wall biosynthesis
MSRRIVYIQYTNPAVYPPLEHSSRIVADEGWEVLFLGTSGHGADALKLQAHSNVTVKQLTYCSPGVRQKIHYISFCLWVTGWILAWRPQWLYASDPLACPIALALSFVPGLQVIYHEHDSPASGAGSNRLLLRARHLLSRRATCCVLPNEARIARFQAEVGSLCARVTCVWNCPKKEEASRPRESIDADGGIWILYHGSIAPSRLPLSVIEALAGLPDEVKLRVIGYETAGSFGYLEKVKATARALGIPDRVDVLGPVATRRELLHYCRRSDIGLALMPLTTDDINMKAMDGASNKPFDYLACGLALIVSDLPAWRALYVDPGYGVVCYPNDPGSISRAIASLVRDPKEMRAMGERGRQRVEREWNYEAQFAEVMEFLNAPRRSRLRRSASPHDVIHRGAG